MIQMISTAVLNSTIQERKKKFLIESGDMIADIICNRKLYEVVTEA